MDNTKGMTEIANNIVKHGAQHIAAYQNPNDPKENLINLTGQQLIQGIPGRQRE